MGANIHFQGENRMKTIGLIGGMSWESSAEYYRLLNNEVKEQLGGLHSAKCILYSVDFQEIERYQAQCDWDKAGEVLGEAAYSLEKAGADFIVICTNTMHKVMDCIEAKITIPVLHIADATAAQIQKESIRKIGLLGTNYTMEQDFYKTRIEAQGIEVIVPQEEERNIVNQIIYEELCLGEISQTSKEYYLQVIRKLVESGAEGIILGCTEIGLLIQQEDVAVPVFDTTIIHAITAVEQAMK